MKFTKEEINEMILTIDNAVGFIGAAFDDYIDADAEINKDWDPNIRPLMELSEKLKALAEDSKNIGTIKRACVRCKLKKDENFTYSTGFDHDYCYNHLGLAHEMYPRVNPNDYDTEEGFILVDGEFVDRMTAMEIAKNANQLKAEYKNENWPLLYSYMLDFKTLRNYKEEFLW